jgi:hypothetical protein
MEEDDDDNPYSLVVHSVAVGANTHGSVGHVLSALRLIVSRPCSIQEPLAKQCMIIMYYHLVEAKFESREVFELCSMIRCTKNFRRATKGFGGCQVVHGDISEALVNDCLTVCVGDEGSLAMAKCLFWYMVDLNTPKVCDPCLVLFLKRSTERLLSKLTSTLEDVCRLMKVMKHIEGLDPMVAMYIADSLKGDYADVRYVKAFLGFIVANKTPIPSDSWRHLADNVESNFTGRPQKLCGWRCKRTGALLKTFGLLRL